MRVKPDVASLAISQSVTVCNLNIAYNQYGYVSKDLKLTFTNYLDCFFTVTIIRV